MVEAGGFAPALGSVVLIDQALKAVLLEALPEERALRLGSVVRITPSLRGRTFATAAGVPATILPFLWLAILLAVLLVAPQAGVFQTRLSWVAIGAAMGGAASNLIDHFARGGVVDYLDVRVWPSFNLADAAIVLGVFGALMAN